MEPLLVSLLAATESAPSDIPLRLHLVELLRSHGEEAEAVRHCATALAQTPTNGPARDLMSQLLGGTAGGHSGGTSTQKAAPTSETPTASAAPTVASGDGPGAHRSDDESPTQSNEPGASDDRGDEADGLREDLWAERVNVTLADLDGMEVAKERLEAAVLAPMRNPELRRLYRKSRSGGVLLYGPPGCGKTFLARATAGELDARFLAVTFEGMNHEEQVDEIAAVFQAAREQAPVVLCLVGLEHLGDRAVWRRSASSRAVTALASELDQDHGVSLGVTIMGSTNAPWDVDPLLRRAGRLEQSLLVLPPDRTARAVVLRQQLGEHPDVDVEELARLSSGYSGRDLATAVRTAESRVFSTLATNDVLDALLERVPSSRAWLAVAKSELASDPDPNSFVGLREYIALHDERQS